MCKINASQDLNRNFILYNLVFNRAGSECFEISELLDTFKSLGIEANEAEIRKEIFDWYNSGMLQARGKYYFVA